MSQRIYSEKEVAKLLRRAVELEAERSDRHDKDNRAGLSIAELEKIASESGIDPELIQQAAKEMDKQKDFPGENLITEKSNKVNKSEIVSEQWLELQPNNRMFEDLVTELNHRFGTSEDDGNWWDKLWDDYSGRAKVRRTPTSVEWSYTDEMEMYTTRVLMQRRGDKCRIRVSKQQGWNMSWYSEDSFSSLAVTLISVFTVAGGLLGLTLLESPWLGILAGLVLSAIVVPASIFLSKQKLKKHKVEVTEIADTLAVLVQQIADEKSYQEKKKSRPETPDLDAIEIPSSADQNQTSGQSGGLRNNLRE